MNKFFNKIIDLIGFVPFVIAVFSLSIVAAYFVIALIGWWGVALIIGVATPGYLTFGGILSGKSGKQELEQRFKDRQRDRENRRYRR